MNNMLVEDQSNRSESAKVPLTTFKDLSGDILDCI